MELKLRHEEGTHPRSVPFNRTFLELKCHFARDALYSTHRLIEPVGIEISLRLPQANAWSDN